MSHTLTSMLVIMMLIQVGLPITATDSTASTVFDTYCNVATTNPAIAQ